ncbi:MAG: hypothetical protein D6722_21290 [Bacteroidetes bacterium]|nr:MAG: hypothetical protein D6722_21290 [Bacteroidota bacterium]
MDTTAGTQSCGLPILYFEEDGSQLIPDYEADIRYMAGMLHQYPEMQVRLRTDGEYRRFDRRQRTLNRRRVNRVARRLRRTYDIDRKRIVKIYHQPWVFRAARSPESPPLVYRRVLCECLW